jgi:hypothetical protein
MKAEHFDEYLYTVLISTRSTKHDICEYLNVPQQTLDKWLREGLPFRKHFLIIGKLEDYLFEILCEEVDA